MPLLSAICIALGIYSILWLLAFIWSTSKSMPRKWPTTTNWASGQKGSIDSRDN